MSDYNYKPDGKLHTRFSELTRCTIDQVQSVVNERINKSERYTNEAMKFGKARHELWAEEAKFTGYSSANFSPNLYIATHVEKEFVAEILPDVVIHSRPDIISVPEEVAVDYKTQSAETYSSGAVKAIKNYQASKQLQFYANQLGLNNIKIKKVIYLIEIWNPERNKILGYTKVEKILTLSDVARILPWVKDRVAILSTALKEAERKQNAGLRKTS